MFTLTSTVSGTQFDRDVYATIGNAVVLDGSTSEPCCTGNAVTWTVQRDVTPVAALLTTSQPVLVELDNVNNSTYTGVYVTSAGLTFYNTGPTARAAPHADVVLPVNKTTSSGTMLTIASDGATAGSAVAFPRNLLRLTAELFADAHGPCEEFWWTDPSNCGGTPYREVAVTVDGRLAGAAPTYPVTYTGADGPGLWEPIPSPRAWNLRPYAVDLTPFVGLLTDGAQHQIGLSIVDSHLGNGDFWKVAANLLAWTDPFVTQVTGTLTSASVPPAPTDVQSSDPSGQGLEYTDHATHVLSFRGSVSTPWGPVTTTVTESMGETATQTPATDRGSWSWTSAVTTELGRHRTTVDTSAAYTAFTTALTSFRFTDDATSVTHVDGALRGWDVTTESMATAAPTGLAYSGAKRERYRHGDSAGACVDHILDADAGQVTVDRAGGDCPTGPTAGRLGAPIP